MVRRERMIGTEVDELKKEGRKEGRMVGWEDKGDRKGGRIDA